MNNRAFLLTMDNGSVVFAKLPNSGAGPAFYTTASEVATRTFVGVLLVLFLDLDPLRLKLIWLRDVLAIPTPRIIAWSARKTNPVGAEYILEEKAPGQALWTLWQDWDKVPMIARFGITRQVVEIDRKLADTKLKHCGCIYFKEDIPQGDCLVTTSAIPTSTLERFRMGPLVDMDHWQKVKASMDLNRGPCK